MARYDVSDSNDRIELRNLGIERGRELAGERLRSGGPADDQTDVRPLAEQDFKDVSQTWAAEHSGEAFAEPVSIGLLAFIQGFQYGYKNRMREDPGA